MKRLTVVFFAALILVVVLCTAACAQEASISFASDTLELAKGNSVKIEYTVTGDSEWGKITKKVWETSDRSIASISSGKVTGKGAGEAVITLTLKYKKGQELTANLPVSVYSPVKAISLSEEELTLAAGTAPVALSVTLNPENAKYQTVTWTSSDPSIATVDEKGNITAVAGGKATITATSDQPADTKGKTKSASCKVTVIQPSETVTLDHTAVSIAKGKTMKLTATVGPESATNKGVSWSSSNPDVAKVDKKGKVTAKSVGTATITATAADGSEINASCAVTVTQAVKKVKLSQTKRISLFPDKTKDISVTISPSDATNKEIEWSSSAPEIASVSETGKITAERAGTAIITATAKDGSGASSSVKVVVEPAVPISLESIGTGRFLPNLLGLTVKNKTQTLTIKNFDFDLELYTYNGALIKEGSYNLGDNVTIKPGKTKTIKRNSSGVGYASKIVVTITGVELSDGSSYHIPSYLQETWSFRIN
ncbi:MAG: Ig-like domain-containing protein [Clostridia bacterium]|nr:Ig-like domain-containing protein [Clostridia bacterium]